jgi:hypothetical protein
MSCLGVHFALSDKDVTHLRSRATDEERLDFVTEEIEERYFEDGKTYVAESDKAWDAMHRARAGGELAWGGGTYPLNHTVLGGESLYTGDDYIMVLKTPAQVRDIAAALDQLSEQDFRRRYDAIDETSYDGEKSDDDFAYTWEWFTNVRTLYRKAAEEGRHVLFTADQ